jgi:hypothetical protein
MAGAVAQGVGLEFTPQYHKKKKKIKIGYTILARYVVGYII